MRVLHFSYFNTVNVPFTYCQMYRRMGHDARLLTLFKHRGGLPEDICLHKKVFDPGWLHAIRARRESHAEHAIASAGPSTPHAFRPASLLERAFFAVRDTIREIEFARLARTYGLYGWDLYHFHGGMDWFRDSRWVRRLRAAGKPIVCNYHGPDLRTRGLVETVDRASMLNITNEHDLLAFHPDLHYIAIPYDCSHLPLATPGADRIRIIHTPSVPRLKGTHLIEPVLRRIESERRVEIVILTGVPRQTVLEAKMKAHIAIEQIGNLGGTGYGVNSLETLAMNIPTVTEFTPEYRSFLTDHPFVLADTDTLYAELIKLIDNRDYRETVAGRGRPWVERTHGYPAVWATLVRYVRERNPGLAHELEKGASAGPVEPLCGVSVRA